MASSEYNQYYGAERARLREVTEGSYIGGWSPKAANQGEWIQFDLGKNTKVTRMAIQGRDNANWWTTSYSLSFRIDGGSYESYNNGQVSQLGLLERPHFSFFLFSHFSAIYNRCKLASFSRLSNLLCAR